MKNKNDKIINKIAHCCNLPRISFFKRCVKEAAVVQLFLCLSLTYSRSFDQVITCCALSAVVVFGVVLLISTWIYGQIAKICA